MKKNIKTYGLSMIVGSMIIWLNSFECVEAFNFAQPIKTKTTQLVSQLKIIGSCLAVLGVVWAAFLASSGQKLHALKYGVAVFIGGLILTNLQQIVEFMGFTF